MEELHKIRIINTSYMGWYNEYLGKEFTVKSLNDKMWVLDESSNDMESLPKQPLNGGDKNYYIIKKHTMIIN